MKEGKQEAGSQAPVVEMVTVKVDGKSIDVPKTMPDPITGKPTSTTMIQACQMAQVDVPHYCYHPRLPVAGNCRMCLVEYGMQAMGPDRKPVFNEDGSPKINKLPRPAIACATPIAPNMEIYTQTDGVKEMRNGVLEFLLINHPLDCPICDQAGECKLQEYSFEYGQDTSRFVETKVHKPKQVDLGPRIMLDDERCILCSRCVRFTRDIVGDDALGFVNRGSYNTLTHYPGKPFDNNYTLNTVDLCPVGALTSKDFRFRMRVWFLKETKSLCASCGMGCNIVVGSREEKIYRFEPRENDAVNASWMCDEGRLNYKWAGREDRLKKVEFARRWKDWAGQGGWRTALNELSKRIKGLGQGELAVIASARQSNEELYLLGCLAASKGALTDSVPRSGKADGILVQEDRNPNSEGARLTGFLKGPLGSQIKEIASGIEKGTIKGLLVFGEDVTRHGISDKALQKLEWLVVCDILPNGTTALADLVLPGCAHLEKRGTFTNVKGRVQKFLKAVEAPGDARPEMEFLGELVSAVTGEEAPSTMEGLFNRMAGSAPAFKGLTWAGLGDQGATVSLG